MSVKILDLGADGACMERFGPHWYAMWGCWLLGTAIAVPVDYLTVSFWGVFGYTPWAVNLCLMTRWMWAKHGTREVPADNPGNPPRGRGGAGVPPRLLEMPPPAHDRFELPALELPPRTATYLLGYAAGVILGTIITLADRNSRKLGRN